ncbi:hypothetical protein Pmar_PMAR011728 [Perkinsus marinus ATCC 50983]|uniref:Uncharacterized protein n=1 Tax=Perkinsus marinus (strain ATCC 50983 / TXsc) TaxID=423536 RepID=C5LCJ9_PERM5|nr:hypothetical protein Pmar_PMAR011728 [Perkinsus marinus ATCC 50983]EER05682.1 hypothetical protein Pmar_PMAR011728 [Perkinsus marinus ATCC 50983]|eukprot:XP_002773866.1 hypothetical protein Pmar_PMAR011728 [Perkinsus marinus ATCC 50983]
MVDTYPDRLFDLLCDLDAACCRLCEDGRKSTALPESNMLQQQCVNLGTQLRRSDLLGQTIDSLKPRKLAIMMLLMIIPTEGALPVALIHHD